MFKRLGIIISLLCVVLAGCEFRQSVHKDLATGMYTRGNGLSADTAFLSIAGAQTTRSSYQMAETFFVHVNGLEGLTAVEGRVFPKLHMKVTDLNGEVLFDVDDVGQISQQGIEGARTDVYTYLTVSYPMRTGESYQVSLEITDVHGDGRFLVEMPFSVIADPGIELTHSAGIGHVDAFRVGENDQALIGNTVEGSDGILVGFSNVEGFTVLGDNVYIGMNITLLDPAGNQLLQSDDFFADQKQGVRLEDFIASVVATYRRGPDLGNRPVILVVKMWDKLSDKWVQSKTTVNFAD